MNLNVKVNTVVYGSKYEEYILCYSGFVSSWKCVCVCMNVSILAQKWSTVPSWTSFITLLYEQEIMEVDVLNPTDSNYETIKLD